MPNLLNNYNEVRIYFIRKQYENKPNETEKLEFPAV